MRVRLYTKDNICNRSEKIPSTWQDCSQLGHFIERTNPWHFLTRFLLSTIIRIQYAFQHSLGVTESSRQQTIPHFMFSDSLTAVFFFCRAWVKLQIQWPVLFLVVRKLLETILTCSISNRIYITSEKRADYMLICLSVVFLKNFTCLLRFSIKCRN